MSEAPRHVEDAAAQLRDWLGRAQERLRRELAQGHDHARLDERQLLEQERLARRHFIGLGIAIARRAALDHVGDVDLLAGHAHGLDDLGEQLAGAADERLALLVLVLARRLADEHQAGLRVADAEDHLPAAERGQLAARAARADVLAQRLQPLRSRQRRG